jgi:hypothetical protein
MERVFGRPQVVQDTIPYRRLSSLPDLAGGPKPGTFATDSKSAIKRRLGELNARHGWGLTDEV